ncbi:MAG: T9SS type A sorting domain-containing protein [Ignavibacteriae bacterium]|nr:T9SS type A sorting domain-containing protein [Ignavibacteriota bacterium]
MCNTTPRFSMMMLVVLICTCHAQQMLPGSAEVLLSDTPAMRFTRPWISVNGRGEALVLWDGGRAWVDANLDRRQRALPGPEIQALFGLQDTMWFGMISRTTVYDGGWLGNESDYRLVRGAGSSILDSTIIVLTSAGLLSRAEPGEFRSERISVLDGFLHDSKVFLTSHVRLASSSTGLSFNGTQHKVRQWDPVLHRIRDVHTYTFPNWSDLGWVTGDTLPTLAHVSRPANNALTLYWRTRAESFRQGINYYHRFLCILDLPSVTQQPQFLIDSVRSDSLDLSDQALAPEGATVDIVRRDTKSSQLFVDRFNMVDSSLQRSTLTGAVRAHDVMYAGNELPPAQPAHYNAQADYVVRRLDDGRRLLVWSSPDPDGEHDILACVYDKDWRVLGAVKRVNLDTTGQKVFPSVAVAGSRVYVTWQDTRRRVIDTYVRSFELDQLTSTDPMPAPSVLRLDGPWPQPASSLLRFNVHAPVGAASMHIGLYDVLGRIVVSEQQDLKNIYHHSLDLRHLRTGHYTLVLTAGTSRLSRSILVAR